MPIHQAGAVNVQDSFPKAGNERYSLFSLKFIKTIIRFDAATVICYKKKNDFLYSQKKNASTIEISVFVHFPEQQ